jgi:hypothetical protein
MAAQAEHPTTQRRLCVSIRLLSSVPARQPITVHESPERHKMSWMNRDGAVAKYSDAFNSAGAGVSVVVRGNSGAGVAIDVCADSAFGLSDAVAVTVPAGVGVGRGVAVAGSRM